jgi:hypothetical protein
LNAAIASSRVIVSKLIVPRDAVDELSMKGKPMADELEPPAYKAIYATAKKLEADDLRTVLSPLDLRRLLKAKLSALNLQSEPYFSVTQLLR